MCIQQLATQGYNIQEYYLHGKTTFKRTNATWLDLFWGVEPAEGQGICAPDFQEGGPAPIATATIYELRTRSHKV